MNQMLKQEKYSFGLWFCLSVVTCGLYHIYHEYRMSTDLVTFVKGTSVNLPIVSLLLSVLGLSIVADAIQQAEINKYYGSTAL